MCTSTGCGASSSDARYVPHPFAHSPDTVYPLCLTVQSFPVGEAPLYEDACPDVKPQLEAQAASMGEERETWSDRAMADTLLAAQAAFLVTGQPFDAVHLLAMNGHEAEHHPVLAAMTRAMVDRQMGRGPEAHLLQAQGAAVLMWLQAEGGAGFSQAVEGRYAGTQHPPTAWAGCLLPYCTNVCGIPRL